MKKYLSILCIGTALIALSCNKTPKEEEFPTPTPGTSYTLEGTVETDGFTWMSNDIVGLYSNSTAVKAQNLRCPISGYADIRTDENGETIPYTASEYEGKAMAKFSTPAMDLVKGTNSFMVYHPWSKDLVFTAGVIYGLEIAQDQTQPAANLVILKNIK